MTTDKEKVKEKENKKENKNKNKNKNPKEIKHTICGVKDFEPQHVFDCGQCFRWNKEEDGSYTGIAFGRPINVSTTVEDGTKMLTIKNAADEDYQNVWKRYFDMDTDYSTIKKGLAEKDDIIREAIEFGSGIRILKQDRWESILSFIVSQNNNIPRIKGCIEKLCRGYGNYAGSFRGCDFYDVPRPEILAEVTPEELMSTCSLGYRAGYIVETSRQLIDYCKKTGADIETLDFFDDMTTSEAGEFLLALQGVGPKVANCILLFGLSRYESFPIDVWVQRVMAELYGFDEKDKKGMSAFAADKFGRYGGVAQQYLFYYMRSR